MCVCKYSFFTLAVKEIDLSGSAKSYLGWVFLRRFREDTLAAEIATVSAVTADSAG